MKLTILTDNSLRAPSPAVSQKAYLSVISHKNGEKSLAITHPSWFWRLLAKWGIGSCSLRGVNQFLLSSEGQSQLNALRGYGLSEQRNRVLLGNLDLIRDKSQKKWGIGKIFTAAQSVLPIQQEATQRFRFQEFVSWLNHHQSATLNSEQASQLTQLNMQRG